MKYQQGTFITVPNTKELRGLSAHHQVLFMWLCHYANTTGECFPSYETLARDCGSSRSTVMRSMDELVRLGFVSKRDNFVSGRQTTNTYSVNVGVSQGRARGCHSETPRGVRLTHRTQPIELNPEKPKRAVIPMKEMQPRNAHVRATIAGIARKLTSR